MAEPADSDRFRGADVNESTAPKDRREFLRATTRSSMSLLLAAPAGAAGVSLLARGAGIGSGANATAGGERAAPGMGLSDAATLPEPVAPPPPHVPPAAAMSDLDRLHAEFLDDNEDVVPYATDATPIRPQPEPDDNEPDDNEPDDNH